ncbi:unnamed protein product [Chondrus crispus]|uniref:Uncharacterized protein n=1 Tax=Chondrus crispus TaxID=2769 RepID=R7Q5Q5_CHOCR|nr:unnamed protein product [Chondrus crispus]CDF33168.1 unnamed protein product [Chondrus crispus]|eukprot:XP_005712971.1 unnamed protein product [Chondrus crispus]
MVGGAWPFLVGGVICLVNSVNERDLGVLARRQYRFLVLRLAFVGGVDVTKREDAESALQTDR